MGGKKLLILKHITFEEFQAKAFNIIEVLKTFFGSLDLDLNREKTVHVLFHKEDGSFVLDLDGTKIKVQLLSWE